MKKTITHIVTVAALLMLATIPAFGSTMPDFASCLNAQGTISAHYADGEHGIAGKEGLVQGEDTVYNIAQDNYMQCFCPPDGSGIQTNWWNASDLTQDEIKSYTYAGWTYIPDGSVWGLGNHPYIAHNLTYACRGGSTPNDPGDPGSSNNSSSSNSSSSSSSNSSSSNSSPGTVLGVGGGDILGLASTGNIAFMYTLAVLGTVSLAAGIVWERKNKD